MLKKDPSMTTLMENQFSRFDSGPLFYNENIRFVRRKSILNLLMLVGQREEDLSVSIIANNILIENEVALLMQNRMESYELLYKRY